MTAAAAAAAAKITNCGNRNNNTAGDHVTHHHDDTSIIIISNLSKSSPSINHVVLLYKSLVFLQGLSPSAPILIVVDGMVEPESPLVKKQSYPPNNVENRMKLDAYIRNLRLFFLNETRVRVVPFLHWQMHNNIIDKGLELVQTKYVYILQHDEVFIKPINHTAMVRAMEENPLKVRKIEFSRSPNSVCHEHFWFRGPCSCNVTTVDSSTHLTKTSGWSDQCHFTTKEYYLEVMKIIGTGEQKKIHPEGPMNRIAHKSCDMWGAHLYGNVNDTSSIVHLDARLGGKYGAQSINYTDVVEKAYQEFSSGSASNTG